MNQDKVKELRSRLEPKARPFEVIYTGKSSRKVNGLYKPEDRVILLHNKNFASDEELIYTAVHEFAHHLHFTSDAPPKSARSHTKAYWLIFHHLLTIAIEKGLYAPVVDEDLSRATEGVRVSMVAEAEAIKQTGLSLLALVRECGRVHVRFEDYLDRVLGISRSTAKLAMAAFAQDINTAHGSDEVRMLAKIKDPEVRREIQVTAGTLVEKQAIATGLTIPGWTNEPLPLRDRTREISMLEAKLARLEEAAEEVRTKIQTLEGQE